MTREQFLTKFFECYSLISVLSDKKDYKVFRARNKTSKKDIVVRSFPKSIAAYCELYKIECENLPLIFDVITCDDGQIILEEFIDGLTVAQIMESGKYRITGVKKVVKSVCRALTVLHSKNLVHRDVKPENIILNKDGRVVLIDFNAARKISKASKDTVIMGTVGYASPEQLGLRESDTRTDIYALGVLLNVMITGKHPSEEIARGKYGNIVRKATSVNPDERYQTAEKLLETL